MAEEKQSIEPAEGFSPDWLRLREPADHQARSALLTEKLARWRESFADFSVVDLGSGTASNFRYLCPKLGMNQRWTLLDNDVGLLSCIAERLAEWAIDTNSKFDRISSNSATITHASFNAHLTWQSCDLAKELETIDFENTHLITGSALLDLTSAAWMSQLARIIKAQQCASLFVLSYNGKLYWQPELQFDKPITELLNAHQLNDKGFGNALGPSAYEYLMGELTNHAIESEPADWLLEHDSHAIQRVLISDWAAAATEQNPIRSNAINEWAQQRAKFLENESSVLRVGHVDTLSLPT
ncbi:MAG: hypothetical protein AB8B84_00720 [Granulosicoccus sp.]